jgi:hypothetical protein
MPGAMKDTLGRYLPTRERTRRKKSMCKNKPGKVATPSALETQFPRTERMSLKVRGLDAIIKATPGTTSAAI